MPKLFPAQHIIFPLLLVASLALPCLNSVFAQSLLRNDFYSNTKEDKNLSSGSSSKSSSASRLTFSDIKSTSLLLGDDSQNNPYRFILSFDTSKLPDNAVLTEAKLFITRGPNSGKNPFRSAFGKAYIDLAPGFFGSSSRIQKADFDSPAPFPKVGSFADVPAGRRITVSLGAGALGAINRSGKTQLRIYLDRKTNRNKRSNLASFFSGKAANKRNRPSLQITYIQNDPSQKNIPENITTTGSDGANITQAPVPTENPATVRGGFIWAPRPGTSWQWQLTGTIDTTVNAQMYNIDLFDAPQDKIDQLRAAGKKIICYFSAGSFENWRPDAAKFPSVVLGSSNGWPGEKWLDIRNIGALAPILTARLDLAVQKRCDGVEPDNVDGYINETGFPLTASDQLVFNKWLAGEAHKRSLSIGLKNDLDQVKELVDHFDWALNEQCFQYSECDLLEPFIKAGKAVFGVEYRGDSTQICAAMNARNMDWLIKNLSLDASRVSCR